MIEKLKLEVNELEEYLKRLTKEEKEKIENRIKEVEIKSKELIKRNNYGVYQDRRELKLNLLNNLAEESEKEKRVSTIIYLLLAKNFQALCPDSYASDYRIIKIRENEEYGKRNFLNKEEIEDLFNKNITEEEELETKEILINIKELLPIKTKKYIERKINAAKNETKINKITNDFEYQIFKNEMSNKKSLKEYEESFRGLKKLYKVSSLEDLITTFYFYKNIEENTKLKQEIKQEIKEKIREKNYLFLTKQFMNAITYNNLKEFIPKIIDFLKDKEELNKTIFKIYEESWYYQKIFYYILSSLSLSKEEKDKLYLIEEEMYKKISLDKIPLYKTLSEEKKKEFRELVPLRDIVEKNIFN